MMEWMEKQMPKLVLAPSFAASLIFVYGFIGWTAWVSLTKSKLLPRYDIVGPIQYQRLFDSPRWDVALSNLFVFGFLFIVISMLLGLVLAILLDQKIRTEGVIRTIYLYPLALSLIVTGTAWKWILNPGLGFEAMVQSWGWDSFTFGWLVDPDLAIYTVVIAGVELGLVVKSKTYSENCFLAILVFFCSGAGDRFLSSSMIFIKSLVS